jgi:hypothetical protein
MKRGIEIHKWGYFRVSDNLLIATCIASTYFEAVCYFEEIELVYDPMYKVTMIDSLLGTIHLIDPIT